MDKRIAFWLGIGVIVCLVACSSPPADAIKAADDELAKAEQADAATYAPEAMAAAQEARSNLEAELTAQNDRFSMMRSYDAAAKLAAEAKQAAAKAVTDAEAGKEQQRQEATDLLASTREDLAEARKLLASAPRTKGSQADIAAMTADLAAVDTSLTEAEQAMTEQRYADARTTLEAAQASIATVRTSVETAIAARGGRTR